MKPLIRIVSAFMYVILTASAFGETDIPGGDVSGTWSSAGSPYLIQGDITIPAGQALAIDPGVEVVFQDHYKLSVYGTLDAVGTAQDSISFTAAESMEWHGIRIQEGAVGTQLTYCVIERGAATGVGSDQRGGGIYCVSSGAAITHCRIANNRAVSDGGGIYAIMQLEGSLVISDCTISDNTSGLAGGGIYYMGPQFVLTRCTVSGNESNDKGGGVYCFIWIHGSVEITDCDLLANSAGQGGGGLNIENHAGNGIDISDCDISMNFVNWGGGAGVRLYDTHKATISHCTFYENWADGMHGGAILAYCDSLTLSYCTLSQNCAWGGVAGAVFTTGRETTVESCSFSGNLGLDIAQDLYLDVNATVINSVFGGNTQFWLHPSIHFVSGNHLVTYCDFFGRDAADFGGAIPSGLGDLVDVNVNGDPCDVFSNIFLDPLFCGWENNDLQLAANSPCLGAGENGADIGAYGVGCAAVDVPVETELPAIVRLGPIVPNPFNPRTTIRYELHQQKHVTLRVFDLTGRVVCTLIESEEQAAGNHQVVWAGRDALGREMPSGTYLVRLSTDSGVEARKVMLLR